MYAFMKTSLYTRTSADILHHLQMSSLFGPSLHTIRALDTIHGTFGYNLINIIMITYQYYSINYYNIYMTHNINYYNNNTNTMTHNIIYYNNPLIPYEV